MIGELLSRLEGTALRPLARVLRWALGIPAPPPTRLSGAEAIALGKAAVAGTPFEGDTPLSTLGMAMLGEEDGRVVWYVATPTRGSGMGLTVDDETGEVSDIRRWHGR